MSLKTSLASIAQRSKTKLREFFTGKDEPVDLQGLAEPQAQQALSTLMIHDLLKERRVERQWRMWRRGFYTVAGGMLLAYYMWTYLSLTGLKIDTRKGDVVGVVRIEGAIMNTTLASGDKIVPALKRAFEDERVKIVVLAIDSGGGSPLEAERISYMIDALRKKHNKPIYAVIQNLGASAAYMIAMSTDKVYAGRYSLVGSIGAVLSSWDVHKAINRYDIQQKVYASGELKAMLNPFTAPTEAAERKAQALVDKAGALFLEELTAKRAGKLKAGLNYASGEIWDGDQALKIGLIDELATIEKIALDNDAIVREYGPGQRTLSPFGASVGQAVRELGGEFAQGVREAATNATPSLR